MALASLWPSTLKAEPLIIGKRQGPSPLSFLPLLPLVLPLAIPGLVLALALTVRTCGLNTRLLSADSQRACTVTWGKFLQLEASHWDSGTANKISYS